MGNFCPKCGIENKKGVRFCKNCGTQLQNIVKAEIKQKNGLPGWAIAIIVIAVIFLLLIGCASLIGDNNGVDGSNSNSNKPAVVNSDNKDETTTTITTTTTTTTTTTSLSASDYKAQCKKLDYRKVLRNDIDYLGEKVYWFGKVSQSIGYGSYMVYVNCSKNSYAKSGYVCDDAIYVDYNGSENFVEDDMVKIWGTVGMNYTYTTVLGASNTIPKVWAEYMECTNC